MTKKGMSEASKKQERQWQIDSAVSTLQRAEQIKKDTSLMRDVKKSVADMAKAIGAGGKTPAKKKK